MDTEQKLADKVRSIADHHRSADVRHIGIDEHGVLIAAADAIEAMQGAALDAVTEHSARNPVIRSFDVGTLTDEEMQFIEILKQLMRPLDTPVRVRVLSWGMSWAQAEAHLMHEAVSSIFEDPPTPD